MWSLVMVLEVVLLLVLPVTELEWILIDRFLSFLAH